jgi:two-component system invasion response regulator UvrY
MDKEQGLPPAPPRRYIEAMIKVALCDDHPVVREGLKVAFAQTPDIRVTAEASSGSELLEVLRATKCNAVILDISLPGSSGLEVLKDLSTRGVAVPVLILSMHPESQYALRALRLGAAGYLPKDSPMPDLIAAVRKVASGGKYISAGQGELLAEELRRGRKAPIERLSDRELQVLLELASGQGIKQIAHKLNISPSTVGSHRTRLLNKLGLRTGADLVRFAVENQLLE